MHLLIAKILKFWNNFKMKLLGDTGALQNLAGQGFLNAGSTYLVCHLLFQSTCATRRFSQTSFQSQQTRLSYKEEINPKTNKTKPSNGIIQLLASKPQKQAHHIQKHMNFRKNTQHNFKNPP